MKQLVKLNTARNCLRYLIKAYEIKTIHVPHYICPCIKSTLKKEFINVEYYHIDDKFMPVKKFKSYDYILYPNYFGICTNNVKILEKQYRNLIVDNSHAFYSKPMGLASFNSLRKFFQMQYGVMDGAYLHTEKILERPLRTADNYEIDEDINYEEIVKNEQRLDTEQTMYISKTTEKIMSYVDFEDEKILRLNNFYKFAEKYDNINELSLKLEKDEIPFVYPLYTHNEEIGYELERQGLLIYRYWEGLPATFDEHNYYKYLIPIPLY
ncbi:hypothetical protein IKE67_03705 [bacterium]|nr:hypothetical protein [bacterium]